MIKQKQNFTEEEEAIMAIGTTILLTFIKLGIAGWVIYVIFQIKSIIVP